MQPLQRPTAVAKPLEYLTQDSDSSGESDVVPPLPKRDLEVLSLQAEIRRLRQENESFQSQLVALRLGVHDEKIASLSKENQQLKIEVAALQRVIQDLARDYTNSY